MVASTSPPCIHLLQRWGSCVEYMNSFKGLRRGLAASRYMGASPLCIVRTGRCAEQQLFGKTSTFSVGWFWRINKGINNPLLGTLILATAQDESNPISKACKAWHLGQRMGTAADMRESRAEKDRLEAVPVESAVVKALRGVGTLMKVGAACDAALAEVLQVMQTPFGVMQTQQAAAE